MCVCSPACLLYASHTTLDGTQERSRVCLVLRCRGLPCGDKRRGGFESAEVLGGPLCVPLALHAHPVRSAVPCDLQVLLSIFDPAMREHGCPLYVRRLPVAA
jgi:hypothetical protein